MRDILQEIIACKRMEVENQKLQVPVSRLEEQLQLAMKRPVNSMRKALNTSTTGIIAEFKRKSPSKGWIFPDAEIGKVLPEYESAGASACSILTDSHFFGGTLDDLRTARKLVGLPLLRKEFIIDPYQLAEARAAGADAVLLIAAVLTPESCFTLARAARELGMEVLLEIHDVNELDFLNPYVDMLGINNRHLGTFETSLDHSFNMAERLTQIDNRILLVSESGISQPSTVTELRKHGFRGFLIGETFMRGGTPGVILTKFLKEVNHDH